MKLSRLAISLFVFVVLVFLALPEIIVVGDSFNSVSYNTFPPIGFSLKWYVAAFSSGLFSYPLITSLLIASVATGLSLLVGFGAAYAIARYDFKGRFGLMILFMSPIVLPTFVLGLGSMILYFHVNIFGSAYSIILTHIVICLPFVIRIMISVFESIDKNIEEASYTLGADPIQTFRKIIIPLSLPGVLASSIFSFIISFDEVSATIFLVKPGGVTTLPVEMFNYIEIYQDPAVAAISTLLIVASLGVVALMMKLSKGISLTGLFG